MHWGFGSTSRRREGCDVQTSRLIRGVAWIGVDRRERTDGPVPRRGAGWTWCPGRTIVPSAHSSRVNRRSARVI